MRTNEELIAQLKTATTQEARALVYGELYTNNKGIIARTCYRWAYAKKVEMDDLMQEAYFMVVEAANSHAKSETPYKFLTFLVKSLDWSFIRYFCKQLYLKQEICCLDTPIEGKDGGEDATMLDFIPDESQDVEQSIIDNIYSEEVIAIFFDAIKDFKPCYKEILHRVLILGQTCKAVAESYGKTPETIRQMYKRGLCKLRAGNIKNKIQAQIDIELDGSLAYRLSGWKFWKETGMTGTEFILIKREEREERQQQRELNREERRAALYGNSKLFR